MTLYRQWSAISVLFIFLVISAFSGLAKANADFENENSWVKYQVPGAVCGNGDAYNIFIRKGNPQKLAFGFSGGGACWNYNTCFGPIPYTSLQPTENVNLEEGIFTPDLKKSALGDFTQIYFPYCTGDVFLGTHEKVYGNNRERAREIFAKPRQDKAIA